MYEKTLTIGTTKVNNAYEWQKVRYNKNQTTTTATKATSPSAKQQKSSKNNNNNNSNKTISNSAKNATKKHTEHLNPKTTATTIPGLTTLGTLTVSAAKPATQTPLFKKFVGNATRRQTLAHQIKRAHRHLLTSGGNDKQPQKQTRNNYTKPYIAKDISHVQFKTYLIFVVLNIYKYFLNCIALAQLHEAYGLLHLYLVTLFFFQPSISVFANQLILHGLYRHLSISIYSNINNSHIKQVAAQLLQDSSTQKQQNKSSSSSGRVTNT